MNHRRIQAEVRDYILGLKKAKLRHDDIAEIVGCSRTTIHRIMKNEFTSEKTYSKIHSKISVNTKPKWEPKMINIKDDTQVPKMSNPPQPPAKVKHEAPPDKSLQSRIEDLEKYDAWHDLKFQSVQAQFDDFYKRLRKVEQQPGFLRRFWRWIW